MSDRVISQAEQQRIAAAAALLRGTPLKPDAEGILTVARHFGGIQIDPTRTVERTQYLVLWSRLGNFERSLLDRLLAERRLVEWNAFLMPLDMLPEILYFARRWPWGEGEWIRRVRDFLATNEVFRRSILDQLRAEGPLQSRQIDDSKLVSSWQSTGWTHGKNTAQMLEFMSAKAQVFVSGRARQERIWDVAERAIPADAPHGELTESEYEERRVMRAMRRFGAATLKEIRLRTYRLSIPDAKALLGQLTEDGRLVPVSLRTDTVMTPGWASPDMLDRTGDGHPRTTLLSPFDPLIYDRDRTERVFGFRYKLEMYVPKGERQFGHFVLPIVHDGGLIGRLDSERDRKKNELVVRKLHWEGKPPAAAVRAAVDQAVDSLKDFVRTG